MAASKISHACNTVLPVAFISTNFYTSTAGATPGTGKILILRSRTARKRTLLHKNVEEMFRRGRWMLRWNHSAAAALV